MAYHEWFLAASWQGRPVARLLPAPKLRFLDRWREVLRSKQMAARTEQSYEDWIRRFIVWSGKRHTKEMGADELKGFLIHLAVQQRVAAEMQNQPLNALVFLHKEVIGGELGWIDGSEPAKRGNGCPRS